MNTVTLSNGINMPLVGFGVYQIPDPEQCEEAVVQALQAGYRMIDTAAAYENEESVGRAIKRSGVPRSEIFVTTKLWIQDAGFEPARLAFERSLKRLQLDYLDAFLIHQPYSDIHGSWRAMEDLYEEKAVRAIGVSNFSQARLTDLIVFNKIAPMINQVEVNPYYQQPEKVKFFSDLGVQTIAWAPFAEGKNGLFTHPILSQIATKYGKSVAQVVLCWLIQRNISVIPKSVTPERIRQNLDVFSFNLSKEDIEMIEKIDTGESCFIDHEDPERIRWISSVKFNT